MLEQKNQKKSLVLFSLKIILILALHQKALSGMSIIVH